MGAQKGGKGWLLWLRKRPETTKRIIPDPDFRKSATLRSGM